MATRPVVVAGKWVGGWGGLLLHRLSTRLAGDGGGGRKRLGLVGCGGGRCWALRASGVRVGRAQRPTCQRDFFRERAVARRNKGEGIREQPRNYIVIK
jgi:hypothetical protein